MSKQKRQRRVLVFSIRVTVYTDFMAKVLTDATRAFVKVLIGKQTKSGSVGQVEYIETVRQR